MITAVVITLNEEANIERCLKSLRFCDEILVLDSGSEDNTVEVARRLADRVEVVPWKGYSGQKNHGSKISANDWILSVDADEEVTDLLRQEIIQTLEHPKHQAYSIPRKTIHFGRWIKYGGWYPNRLVRLFNRSHGSWKGEELHEAWLCDGKTGSLNSDLNHYSFVSLSDQVERNNRYSSLGAQKLLRERVRFSPIKMIVKPLSKFGETFLLKRGFLDGYPGFIISVSAAYSVFLKWSKLWEQQRVQGT